jgi:VWFA-related protein
MLVTAVAAVVAGADAFGAGQEPPASADRPTFRVGTRLATIDAVVVDANGQHVTDLTPEDFEIVERGKRQTVRQVVYVQVIGPDGRPVPPPVAPAAPADAAVAAPAAPGAPGGEAAPRARPLAGGTGLVSAERAGRVVAIVVDDLGLSFRSTVDVRTMLTRYVDAHVAPGDLVAIIRTAGGVGTLQQFTTDRRLLRAAIEGVRWSAHSRSGVGSFEAVTPDAGTNVVKDVGMGPEALRTELATAGSLGALEYVLRGIETLPGRKSVLFVSEGFDLELRDAQMSRRWSAFTRVMDRANRAGVVVYTIDPRGLEIGGLTAEDDPQSPRGAMSAPTGPELSALITGKANERTRALITSQESLIYLAEQTGGFPIINTNGLIQGMERIVGDTRGYYLLGFDTGIAATDRWDPNDLRIRVTRPGLKVRARRGLFGPADKARPREAAPADPLVAAALSPFATGALDVRLTTLFAHDSRAGSYVRALFFVDPSGLTFGVGADGRHEADMSLLLLAIGDNGLPVSHARIEVPLRLDDAAYERLRQRGLLYSTRLAIREAGGYQIRAAVQDDRSKAIGTSAQFVEVPKVGKNHVALSGVVMMDVASADASASGPAPAGPADGLAAGVLGEPALKIFKPGSEVAYTFEIYDGRSKRQDGLSTRATLLRDGKAFYTTPPAPVGGAPADAGPVGSIPVGGTVSLGRRLPRGTYTLQVSVAPQSGRGRDGQASQWVDFEVR